MRFTKMFALQVGLVISTAARAGDIVIPTEPDPRALARSMNLPRGFIVMFNTMVTRLNSGEVDVMYGVIAGNMVRDGIMLVLNDKTGLRCDGQTKRLPDRSGVGQMTCTQDGKVVSTSPVEIATGVYGKFNGIDSGVLLDPKGKQIGTVISQWAARRYPDPTPMIAMFN